MTVSWLISGKEIRICRVGTYSTGIPKSISGDSDGSVFIEELSIGCFRKTFCFKSATVYADDSLVKGCRALFLQSCGDLLSNRGLIALFQKTGKKDVATLWDPFSRDVCKQFIVVVFTPTDSKTYTFAQLPLYVKEQFSFQLTKPATWRRVSRVPEASDRRKTSTAVTVRDRTPGTPDVCPI